MQCDEIFLYQIRNIPLKILGGINDALSNTILTYSSSGDSGVAGGRDGGGTGGECEAILRTRCASDLVLAHHLGYLVYVQVIQTIRKFLLAQSPVVGFI